jgi:transposase-like protein
MLPNLVGAFLLASPFDNDTAARTLLERLRWPDGPQCPRCGSGGALVFLIGGEKHNHREGLYQCKPCRKSFSVTVGTPLERLRLPLSTWVRAAHVFSYQAPGRTGHHSAEKPTLQKIQIELGVAYRTVLRMRDVIKRAARKYRGHTYVFGAWPRSLMLHQREDHKKTIAATGVLASALPPRSFTRSDASRTERLLRLILANRK